MGWPMASRLIGAGFDVTVFDVNTQTEQKFTQNYQCFGATSITQLGVNYICALANITLVHVDS